VNCENITGQKFLYNGVPMGGEMLEKYKKYKKE